MTIYRIETMKMIGKDSVKYAQVDVDESSSL
jgi:hypothetical protein